MKLYIRNWAVHIASRNFSTHPRIFILCYKYKCALYYQTASLYYVRIDAAHYYRSSSVVCLSVGLLRTYDHEPCKNGWNHQHAVRVIDSRGPKEPYIRGFSPCDGATSRGNGRPIIKYRTLRLELCKTAEQIDMPFAIWTRVGPRKHVLDWGAHWCHLKNTIEPSMCGSDAAFLSNYFDHLLLLPLPWPWVEWVVLTRFSVCSLA